MSYKFYSYDALVRQNVNDLFANRFGISDTTYQKVLYKTTDYNLLYNLTAKRNLFDVCYEIQNPIEDISEDLNLAIEYEKGYHPDEVIFVTTNKEEAKQANRFFGEDSIEFIETRGDI